MLENCDVRLECNYFDNKEELDKICDKIIFTGMIDEYYDYKYGELEYRSLKFETEIYDDIDNYQGTAAMSYTDRDVPFTRIIEHKHFEFNNCSGTVITKEYSSKWEKGMEAYYPVNDSKNAELYEKYKNESLNNPKVIFGGRLGQYQYYDMDKTIMAALKLVDEELGSYE